MTERHSGLIDVTRIKVRSLEPSSTCYVLVGASISLKLGFSDLGERGFPFIGGARWAKAVKKGMGYPI